LFLARAADLDAGEYCAASSSFASFLFLQLGTKLFDNPRKNSLAHRALVIKCGEIYEGRILRVGEVKRKAQHPEHQLFRESITESVFAFAFESNDGTILRRIYEDAILHVMSFSCLVLRCQKRRKWVM